MIDAPALRIIGIGSPFGDDTLGFQAIGRLKQERGLFPQGSEMLALDRPGSTLIPLLESANTVVIIDAMQSQQSPGTVLRLEPDDLIREKSMSSSHNLGVAESLSLAHVLGVMPERLLIYGIEAGEGMDDSAWYPALYDMIQCDLAAPVTQG